MSILNPQDKEKTVEAKEAAPEAPIDNEVEALDKEISIYTMPARFRFSSMKAQSANKTGLFIMAGGMLFLLIAVAGAYFLLFNKPKEEVKVERNKEENKAVETVEPVDNTPVKPAETPREAYLRLKRESPSSTSTPPIEEIGGLTEETDGDYSILKVLTKDGSRSGVVNMALLSGTWQIATENWITLKTEPTATSTPETADGEMPVLRPGADMDGDGLTDKEEAVLGSNPGQSDSDGDTYADFSEFNNSYDPAGTGTLAQSRNIRKYENKTFGYSLLYPSSWITSTVGSEDSIAIKSADNQFIQVIVEPNADRESASSWYEKQFSEEELTSDRIMSAASWEGVRSKDGLIVYLTDKKNNFIFTIAYNPGSSETLDYPNLFNLALRTLEIN